MYAIKQQPTQPSPKRGFGHLAVTAAALIPLAVMLIYMPAAWPDTAHNGQQAGNAAMAIAGAWGLWGVLLTLAEKRVPDLRLAPVLTRAAALTWLLLGAVDANARWALPLWRLVGYACALGGLWFSEWLTTRRRPSDDINGILSLAGAVLTFWVIAFEAELWVSKGWVVPLGTPVTQAELVLQDLTLTRWTIAASIAWSAILAGVGAVLRHRMLVRVGLGAVVLLGLYSAFLAL